MTHRIKSGLKIGHQQEQTFVSGETAEKFIEQVMVLNAATNILSERLLMWRHVVVEVHEVRGVFVKERGIYL
jgi:hypothetical protein